MSAKGEANQMGVVVDVPKLKVDGLDEQGHLVVKQGLLEPIQELSDHLFPNQPGVDGSPHIIWVNCPGRPVHAYHVAVLLFKD